MSSLQRPNTSSMASRGQLPKNGANQKSEEYSPVRKSVERVGWVFTLAAATYNLVRMRTLMPKCA